jgi:hypothetical protein
VISGSAASKAASVGSGCAAKVSDVMFARASPIYPCSQAGRREEEPQLAAVGHAPSMLAAGTESSPLLGNRCVLDSSGLWDRPDAIAAAKLLVPALTLESTHGPIELRVLCADRAVLYTYPATGVPGRDPAIDPAPGWDEIPGAAGCTPQSLGFKDQYERFADAGISVAGISTQPLFEQRGFADRHGIPFFSYQESGGERAGHPAACLDGSESSDCSVTKCG